MKRLLFKIILWVILDDCDNNDYDRDYFTDTTLRCWIKWVMNVKTSNQGDIWINSEVIFGKNDVPKRYEW